MVARVGGDLNSEALPVGPTIALAPAPAVDSPQFRPRNPLACALGECTKCAVLRYFVSGYEGDAEKGGCWRGGDGRQQA